MGASYELRGKVAVVTLDNPPVNGLGYDTRREFSAGIERALADDAITAIVVTGAGRAFSGGADIKEFGSPKAVAEPNLLSLIRQLEASTKPVVAAVHGICMGGGLELALGCHYRVAAPGTNVALPEVKIGLIPGAGGTQRLPRVLGVETALNMIVSGEPVKSEVLAGLPGQKLFDRIVEGDLLAGALAFAAEMASVRPLPLVRDLKATHPNADAYFQFARNTVKAMAPSSRSPSITLSNSFWPGALASISLATGSPLTIMFSAFSKPSTRGRRCVPPAPGIRPILTSGSAICAPGAVTR